MLVHGDIICAMIDSKLFYLLSINDDPSGKIWIINQQTLTKRGYMNQQLTNINKLQTLIVGG